MKLITDAGRWTPHKLRALHAHRNAGLEMVYLVAGQTAWRIGRRTYRLKAGDVFFTFPWERHGGLRDREPGLALRYVVFGLAEGYEKPRKAFAFHPQLNWSGHAMRELSKKLTSCRRRAMAAGERLPWLLDQIIGLELRAEASGRLLQASLAGSAIAELGELVARPPRRGGALSANSRAAQRVERFLSELSRSCHQPWTLASMAAACGVGRTRFSQLVLEQTGDTPILALNRLRVQRAERMMRETDQTITQIAHACGFSSSQYFSRLFKEYVGQAPSAWRERKGRMRA